MTDNQPIKYPNECCRCGFCCLAQTCLLGIINYQVGRDDPCPGLWFDDEGKATCMIAGIVPIGNGCCIKARAFKDGKMYDFASLPPELKRHASSDARKWAMKKIALRKGDQDG